MDISLNNLYKVMFGNTSSADSNLKYNVDDVTICDNWNPNGKEPKEIGGFSVTTKESLFRWLVRGDTLYDVIIPEDAEIIRLDSPSLNNKMILTNKIIIKNPRPMTDEIAMEFYLKSDLPEHSYYKALAGCMIRGYNNTCLRLIHDKVNKENIKEVRKAVREFLNPENEVLDDETYAMLEDRYSAVMDVLKEIENEIEG